MQRQFPGRMWRHKEGLGIGHDVLGAAFGYKYGDACSSTPRPPEMPILLPVSSLTGWTHERVPRIPRDAGIMWVHHITMVMMKDDAVFGYTCQALCSGWSIAGVELMKARVEAWRLLPNQPKLVIPSGESLERRACLMAWAKEVILARITI